jgi:vesicle-fusing ATPase
MRFRGPTAVRGTAHSSQSRNDPNIDNMAGLFGRSSKPGYGTPPREPPRDTPMAGYDDPRNAYGAPQRVPPGHGAMPQRPPVGRQVPQHGGFARQLRPAKVEDKNLADQYIYGNITAVSPQDFPPSRDGSDLYILLNSTYVVTARPTQGFPAGYIALTGPQRTWAGISFTETVSAELYDAFSQGGQAYLGSMDIEVGFAGKKMTETPYDQDALAEYFCRLYENQMFAPGQQLVMDHKSIVLGITVKTVQLVDLTMEKPKASSAPAISSTQARGILTRQTAITFFKAANSPIKLKGSAKRPAANSIIAPDFKFEDMGIGGLDAEFSAIFRRAFASRIFPPGLIEKLGIQHVKGILLYGPPGTGKTLIARQIGKMLNAREPKVINGPEVLNKYVGQSEENIRKLFADAEKEYKEKGDDSGLHIIIFDELDAVCKQRGTTGGGTGVGDSVVNQLLSKLDGVDQLNNVLLIGMTNRMDMIDDALLRPGRLEVHMEISLPDEHGRAQILKIHTSKMRENNVMDRDVDLLELARVTKNFSGAEIGGLVKSASSFAFNRHVKVGTMAGVSDDIENMKVNRDDFMKALDEVKPAFGVSEEELATAVRGGILRFSPHIDNILEDGKLFVNQVRDSVSEPLLSVLLHGPPGSGKTALAAKIAMDSGFPFIKLVSPENMIGQNEMAKINYLNKVFTDAYKSPQNIVVVDNIERIIDWVPIGPRFSNLVLQTLMVLLTKQPPNVS